MATADTSIYGNALSRMRSVADYDNEYAQQEGNKLALQRNALALKSGEMDMQGRQRAMQEQDAFRNALATFDPKNPQSMNALMQASPDLAQKFQADQLGLQKTGADVSYKNAQADKERLAAGLQKLEIIGQLMGGVRDQATYDQARQAAAQQFGPEFAAQINPVYNPQEIAQKQAQAMSVKARMEQEWKAKGYDLDVRKADESVRHNRASENASLVNASATRDVASATRDAANARRDQDTEMKLADDYRAQSKGFKEVVDAHKRVDAALKTATTSAASTLAAATSFMKMLDPGSVVRESELGMALAATGALDRAMNYFNVLQRGKVLTQSQAEDFKKISGQVLEAAKQGQKAIDADYKGKAEAYKLRPEMVVQELGQNSAAPGPAPLDVPSDIADLLKKHGGK